MAVNVGELVTELKVAKDVKSKNKYLQFPDVETYNQFVDIVKEAEETSKLAEEFASGGEDAETFNANLDKLITVSKKTMEAAKDDSTKEFMASEIERLEKKRKGQRKLTLSFLLKWLFITNQYKEIQELGERIS